MFLPLTKKTITHTLIVSWASNTEGSIFWWKSETIGESRGGWDLMKNWLSLMGLIGGMCTMRCYSILYSLSLYLIHLAFLTLSKRMLLRCYTCKEETTFSLLILTLCFLHHLRKTSLWFFSCLYNHFFITEWIWFSSSL